MMKNEFNMLISLLTFWVGVLLPLNLWAIPRWNDPQWLKLVHYEKKMIGGYVSQADGKDFFLSPHGKNSPEAELEELLLAISTGTTPESQNVFCRFPARIRWLEKQGYSFSASKPSCPDLEEFRKKVSAKSIYVVFSSYFLSNPASSFGHTFIRLGRSDSFNSSNELLDTGVSYSAETGAAGMGTYIVKGLLGGFPGEFQAVPYYDKVQEYNNSEMRDLWSYKLNFTQEEIDFVVDHLWELDQTHFDYYFIDENCSYHMLTLLEAARPELNLTEQLSGFYVIPADTLKVIEKSGLIQSVSLRPSDERTSLHLKNSLSSRDLELLPKVIQDPSIAKKYEMKRAAELLDASLLQFEMMNSKKILEEDPKTLKQYRLLMLTRSKVPIRSSQPNYDYLLENAPHKGHASRRLRVSNLVRDNKTWGTIGVRGALHDVLDREISYIPKTSLEMLELVIRTDGNNLQLEEYTLLNLLNLKDFTDAENSLSWNVRIGGKKEFFKGHEVEKHTVSGKLGFAKIFGDLTGYALAGGEASHFRSHYKGPSVAPTSEVGILLSCFTDTKAQTSVVIRDQEWGNSYFQNEIRYSAPSYGVGVKSVSYLKGQHQEVQVMSFFYF